MIYFIIYKSVKSERLKLLIYKELALSNKPLYLIIACRHNNPEVSALLYVTGSEPMI